MRNPVPSLGVSAAVLVTAAGLSGMSFWATVAAFVVLVGVLGAVTAAQRHDEAIHELKARGRCLACGYDLAGNVSGVCPECGCERLTQAAQRERGG